MSIATAVPSHRWQATLGAVPEADGVRFTVWAPEARRLELLLDRGASVPLEQRADGYHTAWVRDIVQGARYAYRIEANDPRPDPASRFQPEGPHRFSCVIDPRRFAWSDGGWAGLPDEPVIYELHVGAFSPQGTFAGVEERLEALVDLGVSAIELMPLAEFPGRRNWGYDGVDLFAPSHNYGHPDDLRRLVNAAHRHGLGVVVDVVYNHLGPDGAYAGSFSPYYFTGQHQTPWGSAVNLDGPHSEHVRKFLIENALHWIHEYHIDGLRLDATHTLIDYGPIHFLRELTERVRAQADRRVLIMAEDDRNDATLVADPPAGFGLNGVWADDFHHQVHHALTRERDSYYADFSGSPHDLADTIQHGWFYRGQQVARLGRRRGSDTADIPLSRFVICLQNHDQVGNRAFGDRLHHLVTPAQYRAATTLLLMSPETPLLFMGQEWAASSPFRFFTDHEPGLGRLVTEGRRQEFKLFAAFSDRLVRETIPDPQADGTFSSSRLRWEERGNPEHAAVFALYRSLLALRRREAALRTSDPAACRAVALDEGSVAVLRRPRAGDDDGSGALLAVVRLTGSGEVDLAPAFGDLDPSSFVLEPLLVSEDAPFAGDADRSAIRIDVSRRRAAFAGPGAAVLRLQPPDHRGAVRSVKG